MLSYTHCWICDVGNLKSTSWRMTIRHSINKCIGSQVHASLSPAEAHITLVWLYTRNDIMENIYTHYRTGRDDSTKRPPSSIFQALSTRGASSLRQSIVIRQESVLQWRKWSFTEFRFSKPWFFNKLYLLQIMAHDEQC